MLASRQLECLQICEPASKYHLLLGRWWRVGIFGVLRGRAVTGDRRGGD